MPDAALGLELQDMRTLVRRGLGGLTEADLPDVEVDRYLNLSLWALEDPHWIKNKECRVTLALADGKWRYGLPEGGPTLDAIVTCSVFDNESGQSHLLDRMTFDFYAEHFDHGHINYATPADYVDHRGLPEKFFREDKSLYVWPVPDDTDRTLELLMWRTINSLVNETDNPDLPRNWHEIVVEGAIVRGHYYNQDYNLARQAEDFRVGHVRQSALDLTKEERNSRYAGVSIPTDWPE